LDESDAVGDYVTRILPAKVKLDMRYADGPRLRLDLAVLGWTVVAMVLHRPVAVHRSTLHMNVRKRSRPPRVSDSDAVGGPAAPAHAIARSGLQTDNA
jgi:hypothetical protein